jgi:hypothetical protein
LKILKEILNFLTVWKVRKIRNKLT